MKVVKLEVAAGISPSRTLKMWWWLIGIGQNKEFKIAATWNELDWKQVRQIAELLFKSENIYKVKLLLSKIISRMPMMTFNWLSDDDKLYLSQQVAWATDLGKLNLTKQLLPKHKGLYGPLDKLSNITIDEFGFADRCFDKYLETKQPDELDKLVAILYRKRKRGKVTDGDVRVAFNNHVIEDNARRIKHWKSDVKHGILLFYWGCRNLIVDVHKERFTKPGPATTASVSKANWFDIISSMAGGKFGTIEETKRVNVWVFMREWVKVGKKG